MPAAETIQTDFLGRLKKLTLPKRHCLLPLFEAIVNSFQAIKAAEPAHDGEIRIRILRDHTSPALPNAGDVDMEPSFHIDGFTVWDNGVGFNDRNYLSFKKLDSRLKEKIGGKGIGRLSWLKAFDGVQIKSVSKSDQEGSFMKREFRFVADEHQQIQDPGLSATTETTSWTELALTGLKKEYQGLMPKKATTVADKIIEHCLAYFLKSDCPKVLLIDEGGKPLNLNDIFNQEVMILDDHPEIKLKEHAFSLRFLRLFSRGRESSIHLCADDREVVAEALDKHLPDLKKIALEDVEHRPYAFVTYVHSAYLDEIANEERTGFSFINEEDEEDAFGLSRKEVLSSVVHLIRTTLHNELAQIESEKTDRVRSFIQHDSPRYMPLLKHAFDRVAAIPAGLSSVALEIELHKIHQEQEIRLKEEGKRFFGEEKETAEDDPAYADAYAEYIAKLNEFNQARLAEYVLHRKVVIDALEYCLRRANDGKYPLEDRLHRLFFAMGTTSEDSLWKNQNLWLLDEKLTYHDFLASDRPLRSIPQAQSGSGKEPDILIFNNPIVYAEGEYPWNSCVIIEFKRPERVSYKEGDEDKDPIAQVYGYIDDLRGRKARGPDDEVIELKGETRYFCYIIADMTDKLRLLCKRQSGFKPLADNDGYYGYNEEYKAYFEIVSYRKVVEDAKKRNRVLFDRLGLPHT
jgi:hypothetical protein